MANLDDILLGSNAPVACTIDGVTRQISVPDGLKEFGVESDEDVTRIPFICPKVVGDNIDLSSFTININYINAAGLPGVYTVSDLQTSGNNITFSWLLSRDVMARAGTVRYIICAKKKNANQETVNEWNTKIASGNVASGIETT